MPIGAHILLRLLAEPLKQPIETLLSDEDHEVLENIREFEDWVMPYLDSFHFFLMNNFF